MRISILLAVILILCLLTGMASAQNKHYIRPGGNGDGSSWDQAWSSLPSTLQRGHIYYIAAGVYGSYDCDTPQSGSQYIYIKKATEEDNGNDPGWDPSYADGQAIFDRGIDFDTSYWEIDGRVGRGKGDIEPYGIRVNCPYPSGRGLETTNGSDYIKVMYVEVAGNGPGESGTADDGVYNLSGSHHLYSHMYLHDFGRCPFLYRNVNWCTIEYCYIYKNESTSSQHAEGISASGGIPGCCDNIIRHCIWDEVEGTGVIVFRGARWEIYGNLLINCRTCNGSITTWSKKAGKADVTFAKIYNNTIVDCWGGNGGIKVGMTGSEVEDNFSYNNLYYNCQEIHTGGFGNGGCSDYNLYPDGSTHGEPNSQTWSGGSGLFIDYSGKNFHLSEGTFNGKDDLGSPYDVDMDGVVRGADGTWDVGAYEYGDTVGMEPPRNLGMSWE